MYSDKDRHEASSQGQALDGDKKYDGFCSGFGRGLSYKEELGDGFRY